jgi:aspartate 1-decarboxylase
MLKSKVHRATVTGAVLDYEGSISICPELIKAAGFLLWEKVDIYNVNTGARLSTYVILGQKGEVCLNGAAARLVQAGDKVIIAAYCSMPPQEAADFKPTVVLVDQENRPVAVGVPHPAGGSQSHTLGL